VVVDLETLRAPLREVILVWTASSHHGGLDPVRGPAMGSGLTVMKLTLTRIERLILANQYRILEALSPADSNQGKDYVSRRIALERGYEYEYDSLAEHIRENVMSDKQCEEVYAILDLHRAMKQSYEDLADKSGIEKGAVDFEGFDGNSAEEAQYMSYARYLREEGKYEDLAIGDGYNSHWPQLGRYRRMLSVWESMGKKRQLGREDLIRLSSSQA
jgi:uncharacterized protein